MFLRFWLIIVGCVFLIGCSSPVTNGFGDPYDLTQTAYVGNLWDALGREFYLPEETPLSTTVRKQINWYMSHPIYFKKMAEKARPYLYYIFQQVRARKLPAELTLLPMLESSYDPFAYSHRGAAGLWQMMPGTASGFGLKVNWWYDGRRDVVNSTQSALDYLTYLERFFKGRWLIAIAAYDAGEGAVSAAIRCNHKSGQETDFWHLPLCLETRSYVPKLLALATIIKYPDEYPVDWPYIPDAPYLTVVDVGSQIDLVQAAKMAELSLEELVSLNPGFNRWATAPDGPHRLLLPIECAVRFQERLAKLPPEKRVTWIRYVVKPGDVLSTVAHQMKTKSATLKHVNHLQNNTLRAGQVLIIPTQTNHLTQVVSHFEKRYFKTLSNRIPEIKITNHVVQKGDTLKKIAARYHVKPDQICFWNGLSHNKKLPLGKTLILWPSHKRSANHKGIISHRIQSGDTLSQLAHHYHVDKKQIKRLNQLKSDQIVAGRVLKIPVQRQVHRVSKSVQSSFENIRKSPTHKAINYHVREGDTLQIIAQKYNVTVSDLKRWNQIEDVNRLKAHQILVLYEKSRH